MRCLFLFTLFIFISNLAFSQKKVPCDSTIMCTMEFRSVGLKVVDKKGRPVVLDDYYTKRSSNKTIIRNKTGNAASGFYPVLTDGYRKQMQNQSAQFEFIGIRKGKKVVQEKFIIAADCCHINYQKGKKEVVLP